ncbi:MAG: DUF58 domain-containing protein [Pseudomonadota bacterium]
MIVALRGFIGRRQTQAQEAARRWARRRQGDDRGLVELSSRRVYILPTLIGVTFAITAFVMLLGSMNYNNSLAFALTFSLAAIGLVVMHHTHGNLAKVRLRFGGATSVFAGEKLIWTVFVDNPSSLNRYDIALTGSDGVRRSVDVPAQATARLEAHQPTLTRGRVQQDRCRISSGFPLGLFVAWGWLNPIGSAIVWPSPAATAPDSRLAPGDEGSNDHPIGDDDFAGLRDYQPGDALAKIAWHTLARGDTLHSKVFLGSGSGPKWFDLADMDPTDIELALSQLTRLVVDAHTAGLSYGLRLGAQVIAPASGTTHRNLCLDALAVFGDPR